MSQELRAIQESRLIAQSKVATACSLCRGFEGYNRGKTPRRKKACRGYPATISIESGPRKLLALGYWLGSIAAGLRRYLGAADLSLPFTP